MEELKSLELNIITIDTLSNFSGQSLLSELETIKYKKDDIFIKGLTETIDSKDDLISLEKNLDNFILDILDYDLEKIKVKQLNNISLVKLLLITIILSLLLSTVLILYKEEHKIRASKLSANK